MREIRTSGSEGGGTEPNRPSLPLSRRFAQCAGGTLASERRDVVEPVPVDSCQIRVDDDVGRGPVDEEH